MNLNNIIFKNETINYDVLLNFLKDCDKLIMPVLSSVVDIKEYSKKLVNNATFYSAVDNENLIAIIVCYANNFKTKEAFITMVAVKLEYQKKHLATMLFQNCIEDLKNKGFKKISLEVHCENLKAIKLYEKFNFKIIHLKEKMLYMQRSI